MKSATMKRKWKMENGKWIPFFFLLSIFHQPSTLSFGEPQPAGITKILTMEEALRLSYLNNPDLLACLEDTAIAQQRLKMARHLLYPQLGLDAAATVFEPERSFVISEGLGGALLTPQDNRRLYLARGILEQPLYTGGRG